jgi:hypothetical protein
VGGSSQLAAIVTSFDGQQGQTKFVGDGQLTTRLPPHVSGTSSAGQQGQTQYLEREGRAHN